MKRRFWCLGVCLLASCGLFEKDPTGPPDRPTAPMTIAFNHDHGPPYRDGCDWYWSFGLKLKSYASRPITLLLMKWEWHRDDSGCEHEIDEGCEYMSQVFWPDLSDDCVLTPGQECYRPDAWFSSMNPGARHLIITVTGLTADGEEISASATFDAEAGDDQINPSLFPADRESVFHAGH